MRSSGRTKERFALFRGCLRVFDFWVISELEVLSVYAVGRLLDGLSICPHSAGSDGLDEVNPRRVPRVSTYLEDRSREAEQPLPRGRRRGWATHSR